MPDWLSHLITALVTGGGVSAVIAGYLKIIRTRHGIHRANRDSEIDVLHGQIERLEHLYRDMRDELSKVRFEKDKEIGELKSELTAALVENGRLSAQEKHLMDRNRDLVRHNKDLEERVDKLEAEVAQLRKG